MKHAQQNSQEKLQQPWTSSGFQAAASSLSHASPILSETKKNSAEVTNVGLDRKILLNRSTHKKTEQLKTEMATPRNATEGVNTASSAASEPQQSNRIPRAIVKYQQPKIASAEGSWNTDDFEQFQSVLAALTALASVTQSSIASHSESLAEELYKKCEGAQSFIQRVTRRSGAVAFNWFCKRLLPDEFEFYCNDINRACSTASLNLRLDIVQDHSLQLMRHLLQASFAEWSPSLDIYQTAVEEYPPMQYYINKKYQGKFKEFCAVHFEIQEDSPPNYRIRNKQLTSKRKRKAAEALSDSTPSETVVPDLTTPQSAHEHNEVHSQDGADRSSDMDVDSDSVQGNPCTSQNSVPASRDASSAAIGQIRGKDSAASTVPKRRWEMGPDLTSSKEEDSTRMLASTHQADPVSGTQAKEQRPSGHQSEMPAFSNADISPPASSAQRPKDNPESVHSLNPALPESTVLSHDRGGASTTQSAKVNPTSAAPAVHEGPPLPQNPQLQATSKSETSSNTSNGEPMAPATSSHPKAAVGTPVSQSEKRHLVQQILASRFLKCDVSLITQSRPISCSHYPSMWQGIIWFKPLGMAKGFSARAQALLLKGDDIQTALELETSLFGNPQLICTEGRSELALEKLYSTATAPRSKSMVFLLHNAQAVTQQKQEEWLSDLNLLFPKHNGRLVETQGKGATVGTLIPVKSPFHQRICPNARWPLLIVE